MVKKRPVMSMEDIMNKLYSAIALSLLLASTGASAEWSDDSREDGQTQFRFDVRGEVPEVCAMKSSSEVQTMVLGLDYADPKGGEFKFQTWCNNALGKGNIVIGGKPFAHIEDSKEIITLNLNFDEVTGEINKDTTPDINAGHAISTDVNVSAQSYKDETHTLKVNPVFDQLEYAQAGTYKTNIYIALTPR